MTHAPRRAAASVFGATLAGILAGCVTPYAPPQAGATAKLVIRHVTTLGWSYDVFTFDETHACMGKQRMVSSESNLESYSTSIRAGPLATFGYRVADRSRWCEILVSFYPQQKHTYLLALRSTMERCYLDVLDATDGDNLRPEKSWVLREFNGYQCRPLGAVKQSAEASSAGVRSGDRGGDRQPPDKLDDFEALLDK